MAAVLPGADLSPSSGLSVPAPTMAAAAAAAAAPPLGLAVEIPTQPSGRDGVGHSMPATLRSGADRDPSVPSPRAPIDTSGDDAAIHPDAIVPLLVFQQARIALALTPRALVDDDFTSAAATAEQGEQLPDDSDNDDDDELPSAGVDDTPADPSAVPANPFAPSEL
ncbi:hypothetical protein CAUPRSCDRAFT_13196, partial [Caulochytrium protostelioides]